MSLGENKVGKWNQWLAAMLGLALVVGLLTTPSVSEAQLGGIDLACCKGQQCTNDNLISCTLSGGNIAIGPCVPILTCSIFGSQGACCSPLSPLLGCIEGPESLCLGGRFYENASCDDIVSCNNPPQRGACCGFLNRCANTLEDACDGLGEQFIPGDTCSDARCGLAGAQGACCTGSGVCRDSISSFLCGGEFRAGRTCAEVNQCLPPDPEGACCSDDSCENITQSACEAKNGIFVQGISCTPDMCSVPEPEGACCTTNGQCANIKEADCLVGEFHAGESCGPGLCDDVTPPDETGACCVGFNCTERTHAACNTAGGSYQGNDSVCAADLCQPEPEVGACCLSDGGCEHVDEDGCTDGEWHEGVSCNQAGLCAPAKQVACCTGTSCEMLTEATCAQQGGVASGSSCAANLCGQPTTGVCCVNGQPTDDSQKDCVGDFDPNMDVDAPACDGKGILGGCCWDNKRCDDVSEATCLMDNGRWAAALCSQDRACEEPDPEPQGACCEAGACEVKDKSACDGVFVKDAACSEDLCPSEEQVGACCAGSQCTVTTEDQCATAQDGGFRLGENCKDLDAVCPSAVVGACCADDACTETTQDVCDRKGGDSFHAHGTCDDADVCGAESPSPTACDPACEDGYTCDTITGTCVEDVATGDPDDETPSWGPDKEVVVGGGRLGSCHSTGQTPTAPWALIGLMGLGLSMMRRRARRAE